MHPHFVHDAVARERENVPSPVRREQQMAGESGNRETQLRHSRAQASLARLSLFNQPLKLEREPSGTDVRRADSPSMLSHHPDFWPSSLGRATLLSVIGSP